MSPLSIILSALIFISAGDAYWTVFRKSSLAEINVLIYLAESANIAGIVVKRTKTQATAKAHKEFNRFIEELGQTIHNHIESLSQQVLADCMPISDSPVTYSSNTKEYVIVPQPEILHQKHDNQLHTYYQLK